MSAAIALLGCAVGALAVLVVGLLRSHAEVLRRLHELGAGVYDEELGDPAVSARTPTGPDTTGDGSPGGATGHDIAGVDPDGSAVSVGVVGAPHPTLLAFLTTGCATCADFWDAFARGVAADLPDRATRVVVVTRGPDQESPSEVRRLAPAEVTTVMSNAAFDAYGVAASPSVVLVDGPSGQVVGEGAAASWQQVANLLRRAVADQALDLRDSRHRDARAEADLAAAGIGPGHPSLYPAELDAADGAPAGGEH